MDKNSSLMQQENNSDTKNANGQQFKYARPHYSLGKALAKKGDWEEAIASYQKAMELAPHWEEVRQSLADAENKLQEKNVNGQGENEVGGKSTMPHYKLGKMLAKQGEWEEAIACYRKSIEVDPNFADVYHCLGDALVETGEKEEAIKVYQKAIEIEPNLWEVQHKLGNLLQEIGQLDEAVAVYNKSIELKSDFCWSFNNLGDVLVKLEKWEEAAAAYGQAVELNPDFPWGHYKLGDVLVELEDWERAIAAFRHAIELAPDLPRVNEKLGDALRHQIQRYSEEVSQVYHQAIQENQTDLQVYYKALEVNPKDVQMSLKLADTLKKQGKLDLAVTFYKSTLQLEPNNAEVRGVAWQQLGELLLELEHFEEAIAAYRQAVEIDPRLAEFYKNWEGTKKGVLNFDFANQANQEKQEKKYPTSSLISDRPRVAVCSWELAHNCAGRVYSLAKIYEIFADVEIIGSIFPKYGKEIWEPIRKTSIPCQTFIVEDESRFLEQAINLVLAHPYDIVHLSKPRLPNILFGLLYKLVWDARIIMDIDDDELALVEAETPIKLEDYLQSNSQLPELNNLAGKEWTQLAVGLAQEFDAITVSNPALQHLYGGEIVRHARDENRFWQSQERKHQSREKFGIPQDKKVVLFFGTPREHKGLLETAHAIAAMQRKDLLFAIVGDFPESALKKRLQAIVGVEYVFLGNQAFDDIPDVAAVGDVCILLQDPSSRVSQFQIPAKLSDALGMGLKVLVQELPPVADIVQSGAVIPVANKDLGLALERVLSDTTLGHKLSSQARKLFASEFTLTNNAHQLRLALESVMAKPASKGKLSQKLSLFLNYLFPVHSINKTAQLTGKGLLPPETLVSISNGFFKLDAFAEATVCLLRALAIRPDCADALLEYKNQYCYHAYSSWLMQTVEGISDWHKADGLLTKPDWGTAAKLCQRFLEDDSSKNSPGDIKQYVQVELLLAEEYRENGEGVRAHKVLRETLQVLGKGLPSSLSDAIVTSVYRIREEVANTSEELLQNIEKQVDTIPADTLSVTDWLALNDMLNWNGLFKCAWVARNKAIQQAYNLGETQPNEANLKIAVLAAIDRADFKTAQRYIEKLSTTNLNTLELSKIVAYKHLQEGDIEGFRKLWPRQLTSVDMRFQQYIQGKSVAIVGPAPTGVADGEEIDSFDVVIRFNYRGLDSLSDTREYGRKTNVSLCNAHTIRYLIAQNQLGFLSELDFCLIRRPRYDLDSLGWDRNKIRLIYENSNIFHKSLNGVPAVLFDVLLQGAGKVKLFKSNFYLASQQHSEKYRGRDEADFAGFPLRKIQPILANHDLISQIGFTRNLWKAGLISVDEESAKVLKLSDESYLSHMEKLLNNAGWFYRPKVKKLEEKFLSSVDVKQAIEALGETVINYGFTISFNQQNLALLQNNIGNFLETQGKFDLALEKYNCAIAIQPNYHGFHKNKALACFYLGKRADGIAACCRTLVLKQISGILNQVKQEERRYLYKGLVFISSVDKPLHGMNRSIVQIASYLQREHQIGLEFIETKKADFLIKLYEKLDQCDFLFFNSAASLNYLLLFPEIPKTLIKLNIPIFIYWHETDWTLSRLKKKYPKYTNLISSFRHQFVFHLTASDECSNSVSQLMQGIRSRVYKINECTSITGEVLLHKIPIPTLPPTVLNIASIQERKGTDLFIETAIKVCQKHSTVKFVWLGKQVGVGNYNHQSWLSKIKNAGLSDRIVFPGYADNPFEYLDAASLFFLSSRDDPFPLTILEAMSCGKKIITFNVGGAPEAVGEDGILIKPFDANAAADAILANLRLPVSELVNDSIQKRYLSLYTPEKFAIRLSSCIREGLQRAKEWSSYNKSKKPSFNRAVLPLNSPKECFIIGSGSSLLNLTDKEKEYLNEHPYTLAMNRYLLFYEKIGVLPKAMFAADSHFPAPKQVFQTIQKMQYLGGKITYYLDEYYRKLFVIPPQESVWARKQRDKLFEQHGYVAPLGFDYSKLVFFQHQFAVYSGFSWAKTLKEPLYWFHTSLLTAINLANVIYPDCDIKLLGIDLQGPKSFYHEEIMKQPEMLDKHYRRSLKELGQHPTAVAATPDGRTMFDALQKIVIELGKSGTKLSCCNPTSQLVLNNICQCINIIG